MAKELPFSNMAMISCIESGANTLTYKKLETGIATFEKVAWVVHRIEYNLNNIFSATIFNTTDDSLEVGLALSNAPTTIDFSVGTFVDYLPVRRVDLGVAATGALHLALLMKDFASLPRGGLLIPPTPLFGFIKGTGLAAAATVIMRLYYTVLELEVSDYWALIESRRTLTA